MATSEDLKKVDQLLFAKNINEAIDMLNVIGKPLL